MNRNIDVKGTRQILKSKFFLFSNNQCDWKITYIETEKGNVEKKKNEIKER